LSLKFSLFSSVLIYWLQGFERGGRPLDVLFDLKVYSLFLEDDREALIGF
jgi:hypothetical protein